MKARQLGRAAQRINRIFRCLAPISWLCLSLPAAAVTDLECSATSERPDLPTHVDVRTVKISLDGDMVKASLTLRNLAAALPYDRYSPYDAYDWEHVWAIGVDTDGNAANDVQFTAKGSTTWPDSGRKVGDQLLVAGYTPSGGTPKSGLVASLPLQATVWKAGPEASYPGGIDFNVMTGAASYAVDTAANTVTISGKLPGVSAQSRFYAMTFDSGQQMNFSLIEPCVPVASTLPPDPPPTTVPTPGAPGQDGFAVQTGIIPAGNAVVSSSGPLASRSMAVELTLADLVPAATNAFSAGSYSVYVGALTPAGVAGPASAWFMKHPAPRWEPIQAGVPLAAFMQNVQASSQDAKVRIEILRDQDLGSLVGTEFYIGYGTSDSEMLESRRYRGIYKVAQ